MNIEEKIEELRKSGNIEAKNKGLSLLVAKHRLEAGMQWAAHFKKNLEFTKNGPNNFTLKYNSNLLSIDYKDETTFVAKIGQIEEELDVKDIDIKHEKVYELIEILMA